MDIILSGMLIMLTVSLICSYVFIVSLPGTVISVSIVCNEGAGSLPDGGGGGGCLKMNISSI